MKKRIILIVLLNFAFSSFSLSQDMCKTVEMGVREVYNIFSSNDLNKLNMYIEEDFLDHTPVEGQEPGLNGFMKCLEKRQMSYSDLKFTVKEIVVSPDGKKASVLYNLTGTNAVDNKDKNSKIDVIGIDFLLFSDKYKAKERWGYFQAEDMIK